MKVTLYGAAGEVTGSAYHVESARANVLIDFGLFQGVKMAEERNVVPRGLNLGRLDAVLLTHAHLDHVGRLPLLNHDGFHGPIHATAATMELAALILRDAAKIQSQDNERTNRKLQRQGKPPEPPLFTLDDVESVLRKLREVPYDKPVPVAEGMHARFVEAGHMLGSTSIELTVEENGSRKVIVFSGDLGPRGAPILRDYVALKDADLVFLESTYGDHDHRPLAETVAEFHGIVSRVVRAKGKILVPTFAVGRTQTILYHLAPLFCRGELPSFPVFLDSPMAIEATKIYGNHQELFDEEALHRDRCEQLQEVLKTVRVSTTADESRALNDVPGPCIILAGAGMCNAGRILHHLKQNLWRPETAVIIVGYQSRDSLGRRLVDGDKEVSIFGDKIAVKASIHTLGGFSAHAGQTDLLQWFDSMAETKPRVMLTHGEDRGRVPLAKLLKSRHGVDAKLPSYESVVDL